MSDLIHELVHNLSRSEKVHFKRSAKVHGNKKDKNYLKVYDALEKQESYNRDDLIAVFKGTTIEKYLSSELDYLKERLLISLFLFNLNRSKRNQIQKGILMIESLANKGFQKEALKKLKSIKKSAFKQEEFTWILRLIELEEIILFKEGIMGYKDQLKKLREERNKVTSTIQNLNNYRILREEVRETQFSYHLNTSDFNALIKDPLIEDINHCLSVRAKEHWYYIHVLMNYLKRDFNVGLTISSEYVEFMQRNSHLFNLSKILPSLSNYLYHAALTRDESHFSIARKKLIQLVDKKDVPQFYLNYILDTRNLEFSYYTKNELLMEEHLNSAINLFEKEKENFEESQIQYLFMVIVRSTIILGKSKAGMYYINQWLQRGILSYRKVQARLFSIMIHFKLNYLELVQSEIILLKKLGNDYPREREIINSFYRFLNFLLKYPERKESLIDKFQNELKDISQKNVRYFDFISFDYYEWSLGLSAKDA